MRLETPNALAALLTFARCAMTELLRARRAALRALLQASPKGRSSISPDDEVDRQEGQGVSFGGSHADEKLEI